MRLGKFGLISSAYPRWFPSSSYFCCQAVLCSCPSWLRCLIEGKVPGAHHSLLPGAHTLDLLRSSPRSSRPVATLSRSLQPLGLSSWKLARIGRWHTCARRGNGGVNRSQMRTSGEIALSLIRFSHIVGMGLTSRVAGLPGRRRRRYEVCWHLPEPREGAQVFPRERRRT